MNLFVHQTQCRLIVAALAISALVMIQSAVRGADDEALLVPAGAVFVPSASVLSYVDQRVVRDDLKLTARQRARIDELRSTLQAADDATHTDRTRFDFKRAMRRSDDAIILLSEILTPGQIRRHKQIVMQHLLNRFGLVQLMQVAETADLLNPDQQPQIATILENAGCGAPPQPGARLPPGLAARPAPNQPAARQVPKQPQIPEEFSNPDLANIDARQAGDRYEAGNDEISALLTDDQKRRLIDGLGPPLASRLSGSPPAILRVGGRSFALPRIPTRENVARSDKIGSKTIERHWLMLALPGHEAIRQELQLTAEQAARLPPYSGDQAEALNLAPELARRLSAVQYSRLRQLALQFLEQSVGKPALFEYQEVADALALGAGQRIALAALMRSEIRSTRRALLLAVERNPGRRPEFDREATKSLNGILTARQSRQLDELLGKPFVEKFPFVALRQEATRRLSMRGHAASALGYLNAMPSSYLRSGTIGRAFQFSNEKMVAVYRSAGFDTWGMASRFEDAKAEAVLKLLPMEQKRRYLEIALQGTIMTLGPAGVFRYQPVIDALSPGEEQRQRLLELLWADTRRYRQTPLDDLPEKLADLDKQTAEAIDSILTPRQQAALAGLLGESVEKLEFADPLPAAPAESRKPALTTVASHRRLSYSVRHGSVSELAAVVRQRFGTGVDILETASASHRSLRIAVVPELYDELRAALPELDRLRQRLILEITILELPSPGDNGVAPDVDHERFNERDFFGPIEEVRSRLEDLVKQQKVVRLRQMRLAALEGLEEQHRCGVDLNTVSVVTRSTIEPGFAYRQFRTRFVGAQISATPRLVEGGMVLLKLAVQNARNQDPEEGAELGLSPDGPIGVEYLVEETLSADLRIPLGQAVVATEPKTDGELRPPRMRVIAAARLVETTSP